MSASPSHHRFYWPIQICGWFAYGTIGYLTNIRFNTAVSPAKVAVIAYSASLLLLLFTHLLRGYAKRHDWFRLSFGQLILRLLVSTFIIALASQSLLSLLMYWPVDVISEDNPYRFAFLIMYIFQTQIILLLWSLVYFSFHAIRNYKSEEVEKWRLQAAVTDAELIALKAQINPHFIFNCLNNIRALVLEDAEKAREAITRLSDLLRSSIHFNHTEKITLEAEMTMVKDYLALESLHMEGRLEYSITVEPEVLGMEIPPMAVQILVENGIKHSLAKLPQGGSIDVSAKLDGSELQIEVSNSGQLASSDKSSTGIGLQNIRDRLRMLIHPKATLTLQDTSDHRVSARIEIPLSARETMMIADTRSSR